MVRKSKQGFPSRQVDLIKGGTLPRHNRPEAALDAVDAALKGERTMITEAKPGDVGKNISNHFADAVKLAWESHIRLPELLTSLRREYISRGLTESHGNQLQLAARIGIHRNTLARQMERAGVAVPERRKQCAPKR